eukprot:907088_1
MIQLNGGPFTNLTTPPTSVSNMLFLWPQSPLAYALSRPTAVKPTALEHSLGIFRTRSSSSLRGRSPPVDSVFSKSDLSMSSERSCSEQSESAPSSVDNDIDMMIAEDLSSPDCSQLEDLSSPDYSQYNHQQLDAISEERGRGFLDRGSDTGMPAASKRHKATKRR